MAWNGSNGKNTSDGVRHEAAYPPRTGKGNFRRGLGAEERCPAEAGSPHDSKPRRVIAIRRGSGWTDNRVVHLGAGAGKCPLTEAVR